jgi:hypothetical protein
MGNLRVACCGGKLTDVWLLLSIAHSGCTQIFFTFDKRVSCQPCANHIAGGTAVLSLPATEVSRALDYLRTLTDVEALVEKVSHVQR